MITTLLTILTICCLTASLVSLFLSWRWSAALAWLSLVPVYFIAGHPLTGGLLGFWGVACAIAVGINTLLPEAISRSRVGITYMGGAAVSGAFAGMLISQAGMIIGTVAGIALGSIAFSRTPAGKKVSASAYSKPWINYTCAKGFPIVVTVCTAAIAIMAIVRIYTNSFSTF